MACADMACADMACADMALTDGHIGVFILDSAARTLRFLKSGEIVQEVPLDLRSGEVDQLRL